MLRKANLSISINRRIRLVTCFVLLLAAAIITRLFYLQVVKFQNYLELARRQQEFSMVSGSDRGAIYFREDKGGGLVTAATTKRGYLIYLDTRFLQKPDEVFATLNIITPIDRDTFNKSAAKREDPYEVVKQRVSLEDGEKINALRLPGVGLQDQSWRFYPGNKLASNILGFVPNSGNNPHGQYGVEKYFDSVLRGDAVPITAVTDAKGILLALGSQLTAASVDENTIVLTIEPAVQKFTEERLVNVISQWHPVRGGIIIVEPKTGKIRSLAAFPSYNPNEYNIEKDFTVFLNPFVEKIFELGSVFKPLTIAAALDTGAVTSDTTYFDHGEVKIGPATIKTFDGKVRGVQTMTQVLEQSLNTGAVFAMQKLGGTNLKQYFHNYGLGEKLGVDLPGELAGNLGNLNSGREIEYATASFGQGVAVTPLEMTMALSSLANGGKLVRPFIKESDKPIPVIIRQVLKPETSETITRMLVDVVDKSLAGGAAKKTGYSIAAKTGTAQIPKTDGPGYSDTEFLHSFFGYFPAYDPKFLIFMFIERPQGVKYASQSLTETFSSLVDFLINYYAIAPDRGQNVTVTTAL